MQNIHMTTSRFGQSVALLMFLAVAGLAAQTPPAAPLAGTPNVSFASGDGTILKGYLAVPKGKGSFPAVIMVHEWWGLTKDITLKADRLAKEGFVVLAPDLYRGKVGLVAADAMAIMKETPAPQIAGDLDTAYLWLAARADVDKTRTASTGFCFGGRQSMLLGTRQSALKAVVTLYGTGLVQKETDAGALGKNGPVLGIFGELDRSIPPEQRAAFAKVLADRKVVYTETVYPGVGHAFVRADNIDAAGPAQDAWNQMVGFLKKALS